MNTIGFSRKIAAVVAAQLIALGTNWIVSGSFSKVELAQALTALGTALVGFLAPPNDVQGVPPSAAGGVDG